VEKQIMAKAKLKYEASGLAKPDMRRFFIDCEDRCLIDSWSERKVSFFTSIFYAHGEAEQLRKIYEHLEQYATE
jgi:hypothetical protein